MLNHSMLNEEDWDATGYCDRCLKKRVFKDKNERLVLKMNRLEAKRKFEHLIRKVNWDKPLDAYIRKPL